MFIPIRELDDEALLWESLLHGLVAFEPITEAELHGTRAYSKRGNADHYFVLALNGRTYIDYTDREPTLRWDKGKVFGLRAYSEREAVERANQLMPSKWTKFLRQQYYIERYAIFPLPDTVIAIRTCIQQFSEEQGEIRYQEVSGSFQILRDGRSVSFSSPSLILDMNEEHNTLRVTFQDYRANIKGTGWIRATGPCKLYLTASKAKDANIDHSGS